MVSDLDGTLATPDGLITPATLETLAALGRRGVVRAVATGRSLHWAKHLLPPEFPIDYLIFSTGSGIIDWKTGELLLSHGLSTPAISAVAEVLKELGYDFMVHDPIPGNHRFRYHQSEEPREDFLRRLTRHQDLATPLTSENLPTEATQFLTVCDVDEAEELGHRLKAWAGPLHVCRTTSPLDGRSVWLEVFEPRASKAQGAAWLAQREGVDRSRVFALGNDYNDVDMLEWAGVAFVVDNAPADLRSRFGRVPANDREGFTAGVTDWMGSLSE